MNIFVTHADPYLSALWLDDKRRNKMLLESVQLMCTVVRVLDPNVVWPSLYKATHVNHPCAKWARASKENFRWLYKHAGALANQWGHPTTPHASAQFLIPLWDWSSDHPWKFEPQTHWVNCAGQAGADVHDAYRKCLNLKWANDKLPPTWDRGGKMPDWYIPKGHTEPVGAGPSAYSPARL